MEGDRKANSKLKEEIKNLESELKGKKSTLSRIEEDVEKYTKTGYDRRVAQMEDMRRIRLVRALTFCWVYWYSGVLLLLLLFQE